MAITGSAVKGNGGGGYHYGSGGGICAGGSTIIERSTIAGNGAAGFAGGILARGPLLINNSTISGNDSGELTCRWRRTAVALSHPARSRSPTAP